MIKKLNITALLIILMLLNQLFAQSDKILLYGSCSIDEANKLSEYLKNNSNIDLAFEINDEANLVFSKYPIVFLCGNSYLKLSETHIQELNKIASELNTFVIPASVKMEHEISMLDEVEKKEYLELMEMDEPVLNKIIFDINNGCLYTANQATHSDVIVVPFKRASGKDSLSR